jgi:mxaJ protein
VHAAAAERVLRVCADPNNLPFSNESQQGFENRIAELLARDLGAKVEYTWWSMRRGFVRNALNERLCDVLMGMPADSEMVLPTRPYYTSTYVFASRKDRRLKLSSLDDPRLGEWKIGVHLVGNDLAPPAHVIAARGITGNLIPYSLYAGYGEPNPPSKLVDAVANGEVDLAIIWGPFAGYFARAVQAPLDIVPVSPAQWRSLPFTFSISVAVRKGDEALRAELDSALEHQCAAIHAVLAEYGVPQPAEGERKCAKSQ